MYMKSCNETKSKIEKIIFSCIKITSVVCVIVDAAIVINRTCLLDQLAGPLELSTKLDNILINLLSELQHYIVV